jgi:surface antigen
MIYALIFSLLIITLINLNNIIININTINNKYTEQNILLSDINKIYKYNVDQYKENIYGKMNRFYHGDDFLNPFCYLSNKVQGYDFYSYEGTGTWYVYGRIQELNAISPWFLKYSKNRKGGIGIFYNETTTWIQDAKSAGIPIDSKNPQIGDIAIWKQKSDKPEYYFERIAVVEDVTVDGEVIVTESNLTFFPKGAQCPKILDNVKYVYICEDLHEYTYGEKKMKTGVFLYEDPSDKLNQRAKYKKPLNKGEIFRILSVKQKEEVIDNETRLYYWYQVSGYTDGLYQEGWIKLEPRWTFKDNSKECVEFNFTGIGLDGHPLGYGWELFDSDSVRYIHLSKIPKNRDFDLINRSNVEK